jgi:hypothetical protein
MHPHFLDLDISWRLMLSFTPLPLYHRGKDPRYPFDRRLGGPQSRSGQRGENSWPYRDSNSDLSVVQPVASRYTVYAIPAPTLCPYMEIKLSTFSEQVPVFCALCDEATVHHIMINISEEQIFSFLVTMNYKEEQSDSKKLTVPTRCRSWNYVPFFSYLRA